MHATTIKKISKRRAIFLITLSNIFFIIIPIYFLIIGLWKFTSCPGNNLLPPWLILIAILIILDRIIFWKRLMNETKFEKTFPRPSIIGSSMERIKTWEKNRALSSSRVLLTMMTNVRIALFFLALFGEPWSDDVIKNNQCDPLVSYSLFIFCAIALGIFLFNIIGSIYIYWIQWLKSIEKTMVACLNRIMTQDDE